MPAFVHQFHWLLICLAIHCAASCTKWPQQRNSSETAEAITQETR